MDTKKSRREHIQFLINNLQAQPSTEDQAIEWLSQEYPSEYLDGKKHGKPLSQILRNILIKI